MIKQFLRLDTWIVLICTWQWCGSRRLLDVVATWFQIQARVPAHTYVLFVLYEIINHNYVEGILRCVLDSFYFSAPHHIAGKYWFAAKTRQPKSAFDPSVPGTTRKLQSNCLKYKESICVDWCLFFIRSCTTRTAAIYYYVDFTWSTPTGEPTTYVKIKIECDLTRVLKLAHEQSVLCANARSAQAPSFEFVSTFFVPLSGQKWRNRTLNKLFGWIWLAGAGAF